MGVQCLFWRSLGQCLLSKRKLISIIRGACGPAKWKATCVQCARIVRGAHGTRHRNFRHSEVCFEKAEPEINVKTARQSSSVWDESPSAPLWLLHLANSRLGFRDCIANGCGRLAEPTAHASGCSFGHGARGGLADRTSFRALLNRVDAGRRRRWDDGAGRYLRRSQIP